jgi:hypothetical protein
VKRTCGLLRPLTRFLRDRSDIAHIVETLKQGVASRDERFLAVMRERVYARRESPYLKLLEHAGCDYADIEAEVRRRGLDETLRRLAGAGVYLTSEEFKGKIDVARGATRFRVRPADFGSGENSAGYTIHTSGMTQGPIALNTSLDWLAARTYITGAFFAAHNLFSSVHAMYDSILPGPGGINNLLIYNRLGVASERWFARTVPGLRQLHNYVMTYAIVLTARYAGPGFPAPEFIDVRDVARIVDWLEGKIREGKTPCLTAAASNAARVARAAWDRGVALQGTKFICSGEPLTDAKRAVIERAGAGATVRYASGDAGLNFGFGCGYPIASDDIHIDEYLLALIDHERTLGDGSAVRPLLCTSIHPDAPRLVLNLESGDYGSLLRRACGCGLEKAGLTLHLQHIRSFEKFTSEGMNYNYMDLHELLEAVFPREFGGGPGDYQLREEEDENGQTRITLVVDPSAGAVDEAKLIERLHEALGPGWHARFWRDAGTLRVRRESPHASARGKILPLHITRRSGAS